MTAKTWTLNLIKNPDSDQWTAWFQEFPGVVAQGLKEEVEHKVLISLSEIFRFMADKPDKRDFYSVNEFEIPKP